MRNKHGSLPQVCVRSRSIPPDFPVGFPKSACSLTRIVCRAAVSSAGQQYRPLWSGKRQHKTSDNSLACWKAPEKCFSTSQVNWVGRFNNYPRTIHELMEFGSLLDQNSKMAPLRRHLHQPPPVRRG